MQTINIADIPKPGIQEAPHRLVVIAVLYSLRNHNGRIQLNVLL